MRLRLSSIGGLMLLGLLIIGFSLVAGCNRGTKAYGKPITMPEKTGVADILADPAQFHGKIVRIEGRVTEVCQQMGCWFNLQEGRQQIMIDIGMSPGSYSIPKNAVGRSVVVQGRVQHEPGAPAYIVPTGTKLQ